MSRLFSVIVAGGLLCHGVALAESAAAPDPALTPERVVQIQLDALKNNDDPRPDAGIERTWAFAHPDNKRLTGPLERFVTMIKSPSYRALVNHRKHVVETLAKTEDAAWFIVTVVPASGAIAVYEWKLEKVRVGADVGAWMTVAVSPPLRGGQAI